jgi:uncharacterized protein (DUF2252 family)
VDLTSLPIASTSRQGYRLSHPIEKKRVRAHSVREANRSLVAVIALSRKHKESWFAILERLSSSEVTSLDIANLYVAFRPATYHDPW